MARVVATVSGLEVAVERLRAGGVHIRGLAEMGFMVIARTRCFSGN